MREPYENRVYQTYFYQCDVCSETREERRLIRDRNNEQRCSLGHSMRRVMQPPAIHVLGFSGTVSSVKNWQPRYLNPHRETV